MEKSEYLAAGIDATPDTLTKEEINYTAESMEKGLKDLIPDEILDEISSRESTMLVDAGSGKTMVGAIAMNRLLDQNSQTHIVAVEAEMNYKPSLREMGHDLIKEDNPNAQIDQYYGQTFQGYVDSHPADKADIVVFANSEFSRFIDDDSVGNATKEGGYVIEYNPVNNLPGLEDKGFKLIKEEQGKIGMGNSRVWKKE